MKSRGLKLLNIVLIVIITYIIFEFNISNAVPDRNKYRKRIITYSFVIPPQ